jgi:hypothetical protein
MVASRADPPSPLRNRLFLASRANGDFWPIVIGGALVVATAAGFWAFATGVTPDIWVPVLIWTGLVVVSVPLCFRLARDGSGAFDRRLLVLLLIGFSLKMVFVFIRYAVSEYAYGGETDAGQYHEAGRVFYDNVKHGSWSLEGSNILAFPQETRMLGYYTGITYLIFGTTYMGTYMVFNWLSWIGILLVFQAFRVAHPEAPPYTAAKLIFFLPTLLYWPSALGKDAAMVFAIGITVYGIARLLTQRRPVWGAVCAAFGGYLVAMVRPHLLALIVIGVAASLLARSRTGSSTRAVIALRIAIVVLLVPGLFFTLGRIDDAFGESDSGDYSLTSTLESTNERTAIGGSAFETQPVRTPLDLPQATFSVIYRPFLFEARSLPVGVSALEGTALLLLTLASLTWLWRIVPEAGRHPFNAFCAAYVIAFVFAFSNVANAGILARQRVQMFPVLMVLVAAAHDRARVVRERAERPLADPSGDAPEAPAPFVRTDATVGS